MRFHTALIQLYFLALLAVAGVLMALQIHSWPIELFLYSQLLFYAPGQAIFTVARLRKENIFERIMMQIAISISFLYGLGLLDNWLMPQLKLTVTPLTAVPLYVSLALTLAPLFIYNIVRRNIVHHVMIRFNPHEWIFMGVSLGLPLATILGVIILNNGGSNATVYGMLVVACMSLLAAVVLFDRIRLDVALTVLMSVSASLLLMLSLRSYYIAGFDISNEYQVFEITKNFGHWSMQNFYHAYTACLSITLLPTMISSLISMPDQFIFKLLYPLIYNFTAIGVFFMSRKIIVRLPAVYAYLASIFFIVQPWFIDPMVTIARQEIAFFFFICIILILFDTEFGPRARKLLLFLFTGGVVLSHYSTSYISVILLGLTFGITFILKRIAGTKRGPVSRLVKNIRLNEFTRDRSIITFTYLLFFAACTFLWYSQLTGISSNLGDVATNTINSINKAFSGELKTGIVNQVLKGTNGVPEKVYVNYYKDTSKTFAARRDLDRYNPSEYTNYEVIPKATESVPIRDPGVYGFFVAYYKIILVSIELLLAIGFIALIINIQGMFLGTAIEYMALCFSCGILLVAIVTLPYVSQAYNFDRMYLQSMMIMSTLVIVGGLAIFYYILRLHLTIVRYIQVFMLLSVFAFTFGLIWQQVGGKTVLWLNNYGYYYDLTYTHKSEVLSAEWLAARYDNKLVYTHAPGRNMLWAYAKINNTMAEVLPSTLDKNSWIYLTYVNAVGQLNYFFYNGTHLGFVYPSDFINSHNNRIYDNGQSVIYK